MPREQHPPHALFIKWGRFQAGAFGLPAIAALLAISLVAGAALFVAW